MYMEFLKVLNSLSLVDYLIVALPLAYLLVNVMIMRNHRQVGNIHMAFRQLFPPGHPIIQLGVVPRWLAEFQMSMDFWLRKYENLYQNTTDDMISICSPAYATILTANAAVVKDVISNPALFVKPTQLYYILNYFGENIVASDGALWRKYRKLVSPSFSERNNLLVHEQTVKSLKQLMGRWERELKQDDGSLLVDVSREMLMLTLAVISAAGFGSELNLDLAQSKRDIVPPGHKMAYERSIHIVAENGAARFVLPDFVFKWSGNQHLKDIALAFDEFGLYMDEMVDRARVRIADASASQDSDLLISLVQACDTSSRGGEPLLNKRELRGNIFIILFAGHETTSRSLTYALALLAIHPDVQEKMHKAIIDVIGDRLPDYDDFSQLEWAQAVIYETLRFYPVVSSIPKEAAEDCSLGGYSIKKGVRISLHVCSLHMNPKYWPQPHEFRPERFLAENADKIVPGSWIGFSDGQRGCIGRKFSLVESVCTLAMITQKYRIELADPTIPESQLLESVHRVTLSPVDGVNLRLVPRV